MNWLLWKEVLNKALPKINGKLMKALTSLQCRFYSLPFVTTFTLFVARMPRIIPRGHQLNLTQHCGMVPIMSGSCLYLIKHTVSFIPLFLVFRDALLSPCQSLSMVGEVNDWRRETRRINWYSVNGRTDSVSLADRH